jgi:hypothetical protein
MSNQKKMRIEKSTSDTKNSEKPKLLAHMPEVISSLRRCAYCSTKEREKNKFNVYLLWCLSLREKLVFVVPSKLCVSTVK